MTSLKTNKSFLKRLKVTKSGKILRRQPGQNHFRAKKSRVNELNKKRWHEFRIAKKQIGQYLPYI